MPDLHAVVSDDTNLLVGAAVSMAKFTSVMQLAADTNPDGYGYCARIAEHMKKVSS